MLSNPQTTLLCILSMTATIFLLFYCSLLSVFGDSGFLISPNMVNLETLCLVSLVVEVGIKYCTVRYSKYKTFVNLWKLAVIMPEVSSGEMLFPRFSYLQLYCLLLNYSQSA